MSGLTDTVMESPTFSSAKEAPLAAMQIWHPRQGIEEVASTLRPRMIGKDETVLAGHLPWRSSPI